MRRENSAARVLAPLVLNSRNNVRTGSCTTEQIKDKLNGFYKKGQEDLDKRLNEYDRKQKGKLTECAEYAEDVYNYLVVKEKSICPTMSWLICKQENNDKLRASLIDWMITVNEKFKMQPETLFLAVSIVDRFLEKENVTKQKIQLVGVTGLLISSKYEEIYAPHLKDFLFSTDKGYARDDLFKMEMNILEKLKFDISVPTSIGFLKRFSKLLQVDDTGFLLGSYLVESQWFDNKMMKFPPSLISAGALYLSQKICDRGPAYNDMLLKQCNHSEREIQNCAKEMLYTAKMLENSDYQAIKRKYSAKICKELDKIKLFTLRP